ncbi:MAG: nuclear transport factor 2 family protein [Acidobacteriota bacterium]
MDKEWIRGMVEEKMNAMYGLRNPSGGGVERMVDGLFSKSPVLQFMGYKQLHPLFGFHQGRDQLKQHYARLYAEVEIVEFNKQFIIVEGFGASAHYQSAFRMKESGSIYDFEVIAFVDVDMEGRIRDLKLHFDTSTFLKAVKNKNGRFTDVRVTKPHPKFDPNSKGYAGAILSNMYDYFGRLYMGQETWEGLYAKWADDAEIAFKSNVDLIPYAGRYEGKEGVKQWFNRLVSNWSVAAFNFTKICAEGNVADFTMDEQHYYTNPDGSRRYLSALLAHTWTLDDKGKVHLFKSYHDSAWLDNTWLLTQIYKDYYGYPEDYPPRKK